MTQILTWNHILTSFCTPDRCGMVISKHWHKDMKPDENTNSMNSTSPFVQNDATHAIKFHNTFAKQMH